MTQERALQILKGGHNVFLTGEPGSGKTFTINQLREWMKREGRSYAMTASTGIASTHVSGTTIHSWSGMGIKRTLNKSFLDGLYYNEYIMRRLCPVKTLIVDEVSMLDMITIQNLDKILKVARNSLAPFGGVQIIFVGDFFQLPPVVNHGEKMHFAFEAPAWEEAKLKICYLTEQHRQSDGVFLDILSAMRNDKITLAHKKILQERTKVDAPDMRLFTHNADVDYLNQQELDRLTGEQRTFIMETSGIPYLVGVLKKQVLSPEALRLKIGAVVMFTRNNFEEGWVNGTMGKVIGWSDESPIIETLKGERFTPEREEWTIEENGDIKATVRQYPLRLAWAITVHKSQGMSLDRASIDLSRAFEAGQGYVAISRVRTLEGLHLVGLGDKAFKVHPKVLEIDKSFRKLSETN